MPQGNKHKSYFSRGEYSVAGLARADVPAALDAAEIQENLVPEISGAAQLRPGTDYLAATASGNQARLIPFVRDVDDFALIELSDGKLRVIVDDAVVTRAASGLTIDEGDFDATGTWTLSASAGAAVAITGGQLVMDADAAGSTAYAEQLITITGSDLDRVQSLRLVVSRGPVILRLGTTSNGQDVFRDQVLDDGTHSLAFTPTTALGTSYYLRISTRFRHQSRINSVQFESSEELELLAPWSTSELRELAFDQSADVIYFTHKNWPQVALERRGTTSWSLVTFKPEGGPVSAVDEGLTADPSGSHGNITVTANRNIFEPGMVDGLIRLYHDDFNQIFELAGDDEWSDIWTVQGIRGQYANDRRFTYSISGSWSGTIRMQRSVSGEFGQYVDFSRDEGTTATAITGNTSVTHTGADEDNNVLGFHRIGFKAEEYTSGSATINVRYSGDSGFGWGRITGYNSPTSVNVEVQSPFNSRAKSSSWSLPTWGWATDYPSAVVLYDNRLVFGGVSTIWASALNAFRDFDEISGSELATWQKDLASGGKSSFAQWMLPLQRLLVGTEGSIVSMRAGRFNEGLTATNVTLKDCATVGCNYVSPVKIDSRGIFVHSSGADMYVLKPGGQDYFAERLTVWNEDILNEGVVELAVQREPDTHVWAVRDDGQCAVLLYEFTGEGDLMGWWRFITDGEVESVAVVPGDEEDRVYMVVNRTPDTINNPETGAEELAPDGVDVASLDLTDQSILVVDSSNQANNKNTQGQLDTWGFPTGPDSLISGSAIKMVRDPDTGYMAYPPHNLAPASYEFELSGWEKYQVNVDTSAWRLATAPDGTLTARDMVNTSFPGFEGLQPFIRMSLPAGSSTVFETEVEISFWGRYKPSGETEAPHDQNEFVIMMADYADPTVTDPRFPSAQIEIDLNDGTWFELTDPDEADPSTEFFFDSVTFTEPTADDWRFVTIRARIQRSCYLSVHWEEFSIKSARLWGFNVNYLPTAASQAGTALTLQHNTNATRALLPYDNGAGIRHEGAGASLVASGFDFTDTYVTENASVVRDGTVNAPTLELTATSLVEAGTGTVSHGVTHQVVGAQGQYVWAVLARKSTIGWLALRMKDINGSYLVNFNTTTGAVELESNDGLASVETGVEDYNFNWWKVWITATLDPAAPATWSPAGTATTSWVDGRWKMLSTGTGTASWIVDGLEAGDWTSSASATTSWSGEDAAAGGGGGSPILVNGGFEDGVLSPWSFVGGSPLIQGTYEGIPPYEGSYMFTADPVSFGDVIINQYGDLLNEFTQDEITDSECNVIIKLKHALWTLSSDNVRINAEWRRANLSFAGTALSTTTVDTGLAVDTWFSWESDIRGPAPTDARYIRVYVTLNSISGGSDAKTVVDNVEVVRATDPQFAITGTATTSWVGEHTVPATMNGDGVATVSFIPNVGTLSATASATTSWQGEVFGGGDWAAAASSTMAFVPEGWVTLEGALTAAGAATGAFSGAILTDDAEISIFLSDKALVDIDTNNKPVYEQTAGQSHAIWGAQLEVGRSRPSSTITVAMGTRAADSIDTDLANVPWDDQAVTLFGEYARDNPSAGVAFGVINGSDSHSLEVDASSQPVYRITDGGVDQAEITGAVVAEDATVRLASSAAPNDAKLVVDSGSELTDTSVTMPTIASGTVQVGGSGFDGYISRLMLLPQTSTEAELQGYGVTVIIPDNRCIEKVALRSEAEGGTITKTVDSGLFFAGPVSTVNLAHLTERTNIVAWGTDANGATGPITGLSSDVNGDVTLPGTYTNLTIGLAYTARYRSGKLAWGGQNGSALLQRKRVGGLGLILQNTHRDAIRYGADFDQLRQMPRIYKGATQGATTVYDVYDDHAFDFPGFWDTDSRVCLEIQAPYPAKLLGMVMSIEKNEKGL